MAASEIPQELYEDHDAGMSLRGLSEKYNLNRKIVTRAVRDRAATTKPSSGNPYQEIIDEVDKALKSGNVSPMARPALLAQKRAALDALNKQSVKRDGRDKITTLAEMVRMDVTLDAMAADEGDRQQLAAAYRKRFGQDVEELVAKFADRNARTGGPRPIEVPDEELPPE
jgi:hypothetical protein